MRVPYVWIALATGPCFAACAGHLGGGASGAAGAGREPSPDGSSELALEASVGSARDSGATDGAAVGPVLVSSGRASDDGDCSANTHQTRHHVAFKMTAPDVALLTVTRDFEARDSSKPLCLRPDVSLPAQSVVESFEIQTDGAWRKGLLGPEPGLDDRASSPSSGPQDRPWVSFGAAGGRYLQMPAFRPRGPIQIRYTLWAQGEPTRGGRRWVYCDSDNDGTVVPEVAVAPDAPGLVVRPDADSKWCVDIEKPEPPGTQLSARFGAYRVKDGWWWRLELSAPESLLKGAALPDDAPVVFVLDASRSMQRRGGIGSQLAIARAYLANTPHAQVEFVLTSRNAERVFGHFVPVKEVESAFAGSLPATVLRNGSSLDRGAQLATEALVSGGKPGRVILMTDGELRSRFDQRAAATTLKHAPPGTLVHLVYPGFWSTTSNEMHHLASEGLDKLPTDLGGAAYGVDVDTNAPSNPGLATMLKRLVAPDRIESLALSDSQSGAPWPDPEGPAPENEIAAGDRQVASGFSTTRPPARLAIVGWIWGKKVAIALQRDPSFERLLPRIGTSDNLMECHVSDAHAQRALREGFLAPGLRFWVSGSGDIDEFSSAVSDDGCDRGVWRGRGTGYPMPKPADLPPDVDRALESCHLVRSAKGTLRVKLETFGVEIVDVASEGGDPEDRRCAEEALWAVALPDDFNQRRWGRSEYALAVAPSESKDASP